MIEYIINEYSPYFGVICTVALHYWIVLAAVVITFKWRHQCDINLGMHIHYYDQAARRAAGLAVGGV